jgi:hypothetical protein
MMPCLEVEQGAPKASLAKAVAHLLYHEPIVFGSGVVCGASRSPLLMPTS